MFWWSSVLGFDLVMSQSPSKSPCLTLSCMYKSSPMHAGGGSKPAKLETGATISVPLFIENGETIKIDTRTDQYLSRAN